MMVTLERHRDREVVAELRRTGAPRLEPTIRGDTLLLTDDGAPRLLMARYPPDALERMRWALANYDLRGGVRRLHAGYRSSTAVFGWAARQEFIQRYSCRACAAANTHPEAHALICEGATTLAAMLADALPEQASADSALAADKINAQWRLHDTQWTSGVVNYDTPLPYHRDANNLATWSAMVVCRERTRGGGLHLPEYDVVLPCRDGDAIFFPGWDILHGVTPMERRAGGYRRTAVFYTVSRMAQCTDDELTAGQVRRTEAETHWQERQLAKGLLDPLALDHFADE